MQKYNEYKKQNEKGQQTIVSFDKLTRKSVHDDLIDKIEYQSLCNIFTE